MQIRELWKGKHGEPHGVRIGANEVEIKTRTHGRERITRIVLLDTGHVKIIDRLPDGMLAELSLAATADSE